MFAFLLGVCCCIVPVFIGYLITEFEAYEKENHIEIINVNEV